jgi:Protein tyrosine and serine/threonine kinase
MTVATHVSNLTQGHDFVDLEYSRGLLFASFQEGLRVLEAKVLPLPSLEDFIESAIDGAPDVRDFAVSTTGDIGFACVHPTTGDPAFLGLYDLRVPVRGSALPRLAQIPIRCDTLTVAGDNLLACSSSTPETIQFDVSNSSMGEATLLATLPWGCKSVATGHGFAYSSSSIDFRSLGPIPSFKFTGIAPRPLEIDLSVVATHADGGFATTLSPHLSFIAQPTGILSTGSIGTSGTSGTSGTTNSLPPTTGLASSSLGGTTGAVPASTNITVSLPPGGLACNVSLFDAGAFRAQVAQALGVSATSIVIRSVSCVGGTLVISFTVVGEVPVAPSGSASTGDAQLPPGWTVIAWTGPGTTGVALVDRVSSTDPGSDDSGTSSLLLPIVIGAALVVACVLAILVAAILVMRHRRKRRASVELMEVDVAGDNPYAEACYFLLPSAPAVTQDPSPANSGTVTPLSTGEYLPLSLGATPVAHGTQSPIPEDPDSDSDWNCAVVDVQRQIGEGNFGRVLCARVRNPGVSQEVLVAIKELAFGKMSASDADDLRKEAAILRSCHHPNVVAFLGLVPSENVHFGSQDEVLGGGNCLAMELAEFGSMLDVLVNEDPARPSVAGSSRVALGAAYDVARGMRFLTSKAKVLHRECVYKLLSPLNSALRIELPTSCVSCSD